MVSLVELINTGESIRKSIKYVPPRPNTWRTYSEYALKDRVLFHMENQSIVSIQPLLWRSKI